MAYERMFRRKFVVYQSTNLGVISNRNTFVIVYIYIHYGALLNVVAIIAFLHVSSLYSLDLHTNW